MIRSESTAIALRRETRQVLRHLEVFPSIGGLVCALGDTTAFLRRHELVEKGAHELRLLASFGAWRRGAWGGVAVGRVHPERGPLRGVVQTISEEGFSWIKRDGGGSRKSRIAFLVRDAVSKVSAIVGDGVILTHTGS